MNSLLINTQMVFAQSLTIGALTVFDKMMGLLVVLCFFWGTTRTLGGFNDWHQRPSEAKGQVISGVAIIGTPIILFLILSSLYPEISGLLNDPADVSGF